MKFYCILLATFSFVIANCTPKGIQSTTEPTSSIKGGPKVTDEIIAANLQELISTGFLDPSQFMVLLQAYNTETDEVKRFRLCNPIGKAMASYRMADLRNKKQPEFSQTQIDVIENAKQYCQWSQTTLDHFEASLTDADFKFIAEEEDSLVPIKKNVFASYRECSEDDFKLVMDSSIKELHEPAVVSAVMTLASTNEDHRRQAYLVKYNELVRQRKPSHASLIRAVALDRSGGMDKKDESVSPVPNVRSRVLSARESASKVLNENGIADVEEFVKKAVVVSPNCLGQVSLKVVEFSRKHKTIAIMTDLHKKVNAYVSENQKLPETRPSKISPSLKEFGFNVENELKTQREDLRDSWVRPFVIKGDREDFKIISFGEDHTFGTIDDIEYPSSSVQQ